jgi:hypothetical protein
MSGQSIQRCLTGNQIDIAALPGNTASPLADLTKVKVVRNHTRWQSVYKGKLAKKNIYP